MDEIEQKVKGIVLKNANLDITITELDSREELINLGINSITGLRIFVALENEFNFEFDDESLNPDTFKNIEQLCCYVRKKIIV
ncbi:phosphopantetheine-binding protein [Paenibacillus terrae]|uniref:phosphopantetheine-binding protein n=1 Tax=Paenibacillus terrae TaxID=159743 RepID=UPI0006981414|nr:phosphopantetheine-binding protein [Paenibacillus terrae]